GCANGIADRLSRLAAPLSSGGIPVELRGASRTVCPPRDEKFWMIAVHVGALAFPPSVVGCEVGVVHICPNASQCGKIASKRPGHAAELDAAVKSMQRAMLAESTKATYRSRLRLWEELSHNMKMDPFPLDERRMERVVAALRDAGYKSAADYLATAIV
ncbi:hypothetical protein FOZ63_012604, partial [Perkinsus olseni]